MAEQSKTAGEDLVVEPPPPPTREEERECYEAALHRIAERLVSAEQLCDEMRKQRDAAAAERDDAFKRAASAEAAIAELVCAEEPELESAPVSVPFDPVPGLTVQLGDANAMIERLRREQEALLKITATLERDRVEAVSRADSAEKRLGEASHARDVARKALAEMARK